MHMRPACERCGTPLPPGSPSAYVCSFECTFCAECVGGDLGGVCPNCDGELSARPRRAAGAGQSFTVQPVLPVRDVRASLAFYLGKLGFEGIFLDDPDQPRYAGIRRGGAEIHLQWHDSSEWVRVERASLRFQVGSPDALCAEWIARNALPADLLPRETAWGTREFGLYDPDGNALHFYQTLPAE